MSRNPCIDVLINASTPLLTAEQELLYSRQVQAGLAEDATPKQKRIAKRARDRLMTSNLRLALKIALKFKPLISTSIIDLSDLVQEGTIGLARAVDKYDPTLGYRFTTYAYWWCRQAINRAVQTGLTTIKISPDCVLTERRWRNKPAGQTMEEFCIEWKTSPERVLAAVERYKRAYVSSLDRPVGVDVDATGERSNLSEITADRRVYDIESIDLIEAVDDLRNHERVEVRDAVALFELAEIASPSELNELVGGFHGAGKKELNKMSKVINNVVPIHIKERIHA